MILFMVFCGLVCPVEFMPPWAQLISKALPLTYGIRLMRASLLGIGTVDPTYDILALLILGAIYVALGAVTLAQIEKNLRKKALFSVF
jgi:ABC-type polysaccharide/polyol phosphate export permease